MVTTLLSNESEVIEAAKAEVTPRQIPPIEAFRSLDVPAVKNEIAIKRAISETFAAGESAFIAGPTGCGKTTCIPLLIRSMQEEIEARRSHSEGFATGQVLVTQPRRFVATSMASWVSSLLGEEVGGRVGYEIGQDYQNKGSDINFVTEGVLINKLEKDPLLREVDVIMFDEVHEASLDLYILFGLAKQINTAREEHNAKITDIRDRLPKIKFVFSSATADADDYLEFFDSKATVETIAPDAPKTKRNVKRNVVELEASTYKVEEYYLEKPTRSLFEAAAAKTLEIIKSEKEEDQGDILIFMPGDEEISETHRNIQKLLIKEKIDPDSVEIIELNASTPDITKNDLYSPSAKRRIIIATNVAETSVTLPHINHVIDSGLIKQLEYDEETGITELKVTYHSQSGLRQRRGRVGRLRDGKYHALFTKEEFQTVLDQRTGEKMSRPSSTNPEILRIDLSNLVLKLKSLGIKDVRNFDFLRKPEIGKIDDAIRTLKTIGVLDENEKTTEIADFISSIEAGSVQIGRMLYEATKNEYTQYTDVACVVSAFMSSMTRPLFYVPGEAAIVAELRRSGNANPSDRDIAARRNTAFSIHKSFKHPSSEFLSFWNVWTSFQDEISEYKKIEVAGETNGEKLNEHLYSWCKEHYLNYHVLTNAQRVYYKIVSKLGRKGIEVRHIDKTNYVDDEALEAIGVSTVAGYLSNLYIKSDADPYTYTPLASKGKVFIQIHPSNGVADTRPDIIVAAQVRKGFRTSRGVKMSTTYGHQCTAVEPEWIARVAPDRIRRMRRDSRLGAELNIRTGRVEAPYDYIFLGVEGEIPFGAVSGEVDEAEARVVLAKAVMSGDVDIFGEAGLIIRETIAEYKRLLIKVGGPERLVDTSDAVAQKLEKHGISNLRQLNQLAKTDPEALTVRISDLIPQDALKKINENYPDSMKIGPNDYRIDYTRSAGAFGSRRVSAFVPFEEVLALNEMPTLPTEGIIVVKVVDSSGTPYSIYRNEGLANLKNTVVRTISGEKWDRAPRELRTSGKESIVYGKIKVGYDVNGKPIYKSLVAKKNRFGSYALPDSYTELLEEPDAEVKRSNFAQLEKIPEGYTIKPGKEKLVDDAQNKLRARINLLETTYDTALNNAVDLRDANNNGRAEVVIERADDKRKALESLESVDKNLLLRLTLTQIADGSYQEIVDYYDLVANAATPLSLTLRLQPKNDTVDRDAVYAVKGKAKDGVYEVEELPQLVQILETDAIVKTQLEKIRSNLVQIVT